MQMVAVGRRGLMEAERVQRAEPLVQKVVQAGAVGEATLVAPVVRAAMVGSQVVGEAVEEEAPPLAGEAESAEPGKFVCGHFKPRINKRIP